MKSSSVRILMVAALFMMPGCGNRTPQASQPADQSTTDGVLERFEKISLSSVIIDAYGCGVQIEQVKEDHRKDPKSNSAALLMCKDIEQFVKDNTYPRK
jgi:hypothetical protein